MILDRLTNKFQQALSDPQSLATRKNNQFIEPIHLLITLLEQEGGVLGYLLKSTNINLELLHNILTNILNTLPQVDGTKGYVHPSNYLIKHLNLCDKLAQKKGDTFISS